MNKYKIPVKFIFEGTVEVLAESGKEATITAKWGVKTHFGFGIDDSRVTSGNVSTAPEIKMGQPEIIEKGI